MIRTSQKAAERSHDVSHTLALSDEELDLLLELLTAEIGQDRLELQDLAPADQGRSCQKRLDTARTILGKLGKEA
jgi:hypothetical protein